MQTFNIKRFHHTLVWQIANDRKNLLNFLAFGFIFALFPAVLFMLKVGVPEASPAYVTKVAPVFIVMAAAYLQTCGAAIVSNVSDKIKRINNFILPASKMEKFISRYVHLLIVFPLAAFVGLIVGDLVQMLVYQIAAGDSASITIAVFNTIGQSRLHAMAVSGNADLIASSIQVFLLIWLIHSQYVLCGTFFRRHAWVKTTMLLLIMYIVLSMAFVLGFLGLLNLIYGEGQYELILIDSWWVYAVKYITLAALIAFNYWAAFRIYSRMQAVNNKWYNL